MEVTNMDERVICADMIAMFEIQLRNDEKSEATISKYLHDIRYFMMFVNGRRVNKELILAYKEELKAKYAISSANSMIVALNAFLGFMGWTDCCIKLFKMQRQVFCAEERELTKSEYIRLVNVAKLRGNERLNLILQTICGTGIRVSELRFITVEAVYRGKAIVSCKNKTRIVFIIRELQKKLIRYIRKRRLTSGAVFVTRTGNPVSHCNIWREMKLLCGEAKVASDKVFPHNLRHLFARTFYGLEKDIVKLADILGHSSINTTRIYTMTTGFEHCRKMESMRLII